MKQMNYYQLFFAALVFGAASVAHAAASGTDEVSEPQYKAAQEHVLAEAKPLGKGMTLRDSKGCAWEVQENNGTLKLTRYMRPDGTPVCAAEQ